MRCMLIVFEDPSILVEFVPFCLSFSFFFYSFNNGHRTEAPLCYFTASWVVPEPCSNPLL